MSAWQSCPLWLCVVGCEECNNAHPSVCPKHGPLHPIPNRPVLTRARASLPLVLYIDRFLGGVFSKRRIPKRTQFGPVEGPLVRQTELKDCYIHLKVRVCVREKKRDQFVLKLWFSWVCCSAMISYFTGGVVLLLPSLNVTQKYPDCFGLKSSVIQGDTIIVMNIKALWCYDI